MIDEQRQRVRHHYPTLKPTITIEGDPPYKHWDIPAHNIEELRYFLRDHNVTDEEFKKLAVNRANVKKMLWLQEL